MVEQANRQIDITGEVCPLTFVKTKLVIEKMLPGDILEVRLKGQEPIRNVPKSVAELGHVILSLAPEDGQSETGVHRLTILKR